MIELGQHSITVAMDGLKIVFMIIGVVNAVFAYNCLQKTCGLGFCGPKTTCVADDTNGCVRQTVNDFSIIQNCSSGPCVPSWTNVSDFILTSDCCFTDECNTDSMTSTQENPAVDECYSVVCDSDGCVSDAIRDGNARLCPRSQNGYCLFVKAVLNTVSEIAMCNDGSDGFQCTNTVSNDDSSTIVLHCCNQERCNDGISRKTPNVDNCYSLSCNGTGCIDEALQKGLFAYCPQTGFGCMTTVVDVMHVTTCATQQCTDFSYGSTEIECCDGDLCNSHLGTTTGSTTSTPTKSTKTGSTTSTPTQSTKTGSTTSTPTQSTTTGSTTSTPTQSMTTWSMTSTPTQSTKTGSTTSTPTQSTTTGSTTSTPTQSTKTESMTSTVTSTPTPPRTTNKDISGSSRLDTPHFIICSLIALLASVISYANQ